MCELGSKPAGWAALCAGLAILTACGGGGGSESLPTANGQVSATAPDAAAFAAQADARAQASAFRVAQASYYVDATVGEDTGDGSMASPWKTLSRLKSVQLGTGQSLNLRCGAIWRESLTLTSFHLPAGSIVAGYGNCKAAPARISASDDFSNGWTKSAAIWSRSVPVGTPKIARLFVSGVAHRVAQWPNYGGIGAEYAKADPASPTSRNSLTVSLADRAALAPRALGGALARVRSEPWAVESLSVSGWNSSTGVLSFSANATNNMEAGNGYVLQDQLWMLDTDGEFFHDTVNNRLYVMPAQAASQGFDLNTMSVEGSVRDTALVISKVPGVVLRDLALTHARTMALSLENSQGARLSSLTVVGNANTGIRIIAAGAPKGTAGATISASTLVDNWRLGIDAGAAIGVVVSGNTITDTGTIAGVGASAAAVLVGEAGQIVNNRVQRTAFHGLRYSGAGGTKVTGNLITDYCMRLSDCGGIYTWNGSSAPQQTSNMSSLVSQNRLSSAWSNVEGASGPGAGLVAGIYLDNFSRGVTVSGNTVAASVIGIHLHNGANNTISDNQFWLSTRASVSMSMDVAGGTDYLTGNLVTRNTLVPAQAASGNYPALPSFGGVLAVQFRNTVSGLGSITSGSNVFSANNIVMLNGRSSALAQVSDAANTLSFGASAWVKLNAAELPVQSKPSYALYQATLGAELLSNGGYEGELAPWSAWYAGGAGSGNLALASGMAGCLNTCALLSVGGGSDSLMSSPFIMTAGLPYLVSFQATLTADATVGTPYLAQTSSPYANLVDSRGIVSPTMRTALAGDVVVYEGFLAPASADSARLNLKIATPQVNVAFDNASLRPVTGYTLSSMRDYASSVHAEPGLSTTVDCEALGWPAGCTATDITGKAVALPLNLPAGTSTLLLRADSPWRQ